MSDSNMVVPEQWFWRGGAVCNGHASLVMLLFGCLTSTIKLLRSAGNMGIAKHVFTALANETAGHRHVRTRLE